jgi:hypothetical protein
MGRKATILSDEKKAIALGNGLSLQTVYARLNRGWDVDKAISTKPMATPFTELERSPTGEIKSDNPKGILRTFSIHKQLDDKLDQLIEASGMNQSSFIGKIVEDYINEQS